MSRIAALRATINADNRYSSRLANSLVDVQVNSRTHSIEVHANANAFRVSIREVDSIDPGGARCTQKAFVRLDNAAMVGLCAGTHHLMLLTDIEAGVLAAHRALGA